MSNYLVPDIMHEHGATQVAVDFYPRKRSYYSNTERCGGAFAYRYFNDDDQEIGYLLIDSRDYFIFQEPREWAEQFLDTLEWQVETHSHD
jgi:hypothetical protein